MSRFLTLSALLVFSLSASAAGLGFNPFDKGSPTSAGGATGSRPSNPSATPAPPKAAPAPVVNSQSKPEAPPNKPAQASQQNKK